MRLMVGDDIEDASRRGRRLVHDLAAYGTARDAAEDALARLLVALRSGATAPDVAELSRAALDAVGLLWETSSRLSE